MISFEVSKIHVPLGCHRRLHLGLLGLDLWSFASYLPRARGENWINIYDSENDFYKNGRNKRINIGCNIRLWKRLIFSYCTKNCLDRVGHDYDSHDFDWRIWPIPALNHRSDFNLGGGVWGTFSRGFLWLRWSCLAGQDSPSGSPPSEKKNMQNHLHFEPPFPLSCLPFVLIQPQRVINVVAVMECLRDYCCHGMPKRFCGTCASAFLLQVFCCSVSSCVFLIRRQSCLVLLLHLLAAGFSETLETQVHTLYIYMI